MKDLRNPFLLRASEHIEADATFVRLYGPGALELIKATQPLATRIFLSASGGGKTSLLRLFTPGPLLELHKHRDVEHYSDLYETMNGLGVVNENGPRLLGIPVSCDRGYVNLADIGLDAAKQTRLLFALLDARLILAALRHAMALKRLKPDEPLNRFELLAPAVPVEIPGLTLPCRGDVLHAWARRREEEICATLDSFSPEETAATGTDGLLALDLLKPGQLLLDGQPVSEHVLIMLDDVQKLTASQRDRLIRFVLDKRSSTPVWIAERLEALSRDELLDLGSVEGRDYERIFLENYWRGHQKRFENIMVNIADRRARDSRSVDLSHFQPCLEDSLDGPEWEPKFKRAADTIVARVRGKAAGTSLFENWLAEREALQGTPRDKAIAWRALEILMERELKRKQPSLGFALDADALAEKNDASIKAAAELFVANEFELPYYYGMPTLAKLAAFNIQQFLALGGVEFEEVISTAVVNPLEPPMLPAARQEALMMQASRGLWEEIPRRAAHGSRVKSLLESIGSFSRWYTERPTAPNDPGVNAIAISMADRDRLLNADWIRLHPPHKLLADVIASALAHNLLDAQPNYKCKGQVWMVLNLNRLLCVRYRLPLGYGLFKEQRLDDLVRWMEKGFESKPQNEDELL